MRGLYRGKDKSRGFKKGETYNLKSEVNFGYIWIIDVDTGLNCPYSTIEKVLQNWILRGI